MTANSEEYIVDLVWDNEAAVWIATSESIPGLVLESGSLDALIERARFAIPQLLVLNSGTKSGELFICFRAERHEQGYA